jgi:hypothetical protein
MGQEEVARLITEHGDDRGVKPPAHFQRNLVFHLALES